MREPAAFVDGASQIGDRGTGWITAVFLAAALTAALSALWGELSSRNKGRTSRSSLFALVMTSVALLLVLGMQVFALGLLGELIIFTHARGLKDYRVEEIIQYPEAVAVADSGNGSLPEEPAARPEMRTSAPPAITA